MDAQDLQARSLRGEALSLPLYLGASVLARITRHFSGLCRRLEKGRSVAVSEKVRVFAVVTGDSGIPFAEGG